MKRIGWGLVILLALAAGVAGWYLWTSPQEARTWYTSRGVPEAWVNGIATWLGVAEADADPARVVASGTIEAKEVTLAAELGDRISDTFAAEGDLVWEGTLLVQLDDADVQAEITESEAAAEVARANLLQVRAGPRTSDLRAAEATVARAEAELDGARAALRNAEAMLNDPQGLRAQIDATRGQVRLSDTQVEQARAAARMAEILRESGNPFGSDWEKTEVAAYEKRLEAAQSRLTMVQTAYQGAQQSLEALEAMRENPLALQAQVHAAGSQVAVAEAALEMTAAQLALLQAGPRAESIDVAEAQFHVAEAVLAVLKVKRDKMDLNSPIDSLVTRRVLQEGEMALPGLPLMSIADLNEVELTIYVPTDQIGRVQVGQVAEVAVGSFPGRTFAGRVSHIASEAEFTPRSVQAQEERARTVFSVRIALPNPDHCLKPGMPADARLK